jgi:regulatory protein
VEKGYGPVRIGRELREKGVEPELIEELLAAPALDWLERAARVREKKFGRGKATNYREQARQARFLQYRGFSSEQIHRLFRE